MDVDVDADVDDVDTAGVDGNGDDIIGAFAFSFDPPSRDSCSGRLVACPGFADPFFVDFGDVGLYALCELSGCLLFDTLELVPIPEPDSTLAEGPCEAALAATAALCASACLCAAESPCRCLCSRCCCSSFCHSCRNLSSSSSVGGGGGVVVLSMTTRRYQY